MKTPFYIINTLPIPRPIRPRRPSCLGGERVKFVAGGSTIFVLQLSQGSFQHAMDRYIASTFARIYIRTDVGALGNLSSRWMREAAARHHTSTVFTHNSIKPKEKKNSKMTEDGVSELLGM